MLRDVGSSPNAYAPTIPSLLYMAFQMKFAVITPALIAGAFAERMHFRGYLAFIGLWSLVVYCPFAHWVWGGGFLGSGGLHAIDFAGGSVVHELAGRGGLGDGDLPRAAPDARPAAQRAARPARCGHPVVRMVRFQRRQRAVAGAVAASALVNTQLGACAAMLAWMAIEWVQRRKPSGVGIASGAVAGLAAITPASGYVPPWAALVIGAAAGLLCYGAVQLKDRSCTTTTRSTWSASTWSEGALGVVLTGVFASLAVNAAGVAGSWTQFGRQVVLALAAIVYPFVMTWIVLWVVDKSVGLRVSPDEEAAGLDLGELAEVAYRRVR